MRIAVIGWGSLIWRPGSLKIRTRWRLDGPKLPIEFARISSDGRLTLVIKAGVDMQGTYWALSEFHRIADARENLRLREGPRTSLAKIHFLTKAGQLSEGIPPQVLRIVRVWIADRDDLDAAIWTGLTTNWKEKRARSFTARDAVRYLKELETQKDISRATYDRAREYIENAPAQVRTRVRHAMMKRGWVPRQLPSVLFDG